MVARFHFDGALHADDGSVAYFHLSRDVAMPTDEKCKNLGGWGLGVTQGHQKHCRLIERPPMTSYSTLIETIRLSCTVFKL